MRGILHILKQKRGIMLCFTIFRRFTCFKTVRIQGMSCHHCGPWSKYMLESRQNKRFVRACATETKDVFRITNLVLFLDKIVSAAHFLVIFQQFGHGVRYQQAAHRPYFTTKQGE